MATPAHFGALANYSCHDFSGARSWLVEATTIPDWYPRIFSAEGPDVYLLPLAWWCIEISPSAGIAHTPWVPMMQQNLALPGPIGINGNDIRLRAWASPGVQIAATII